MNNLIEPGDQNRIKRKMKLNEQGLASQEPARLNEIGPKIVGLHAAQKKFSIRR